MIVRTVFCASALLAMCVACSNEPAKYPSTKGMTPHEARTMYNEAYKRQPVSYEKVLAERDRLWRTDER
jgi:hypothetical protein